MKLADGDGLKTNLRWMLCKFIEKAIVFFVSVGDWAKIEMDDLIGSIKRVYPGAKVDWDYEGGPGDGDWERIF